MKEIAVIGHDLQPEDIKTTADGMTEFPMPPDAAYGGVRNLLSRLSTLESLSFCGDSAQLSAFINSINSGVTSLSLERLSRLQLGDIYKFRELRRLTIRAPLEVEDARAIKLSKSVMWESFYAIRMLLEQNAATLEELVLGNLDLDMLFENYVPILTKLKCLAIELDPAMCCAGDRGISTDKRVLTATTQISTKIEDTPRWSWFGELINLTRSNMKVFFSASNESGRAFCDQEISGLQGAVKGIDWKLLHKLEGGRRVKRKSVFRGHKMPEFVDWTRQGLAESVVLIELTIRRHRSVVSR